MDLSKFLWLLQRQALFFARADKLDDQYEGYYTRADAAAIVDRFGSLRGQIRMCSPMIEEHIIHQRIEEIFTYFRKMRTRFFVNCWHMNEEESSAMWKLYTTQNEGICVTSTFLKLRNALPSAAYLGIVKYIDYKRDFVNPDIHGIDINASIALKLIMHKRQSYEHEREARAVIWAERETFTKDLAQANDGYIIPVDLSKVLDAVYLSPNSPPMLVEIVTDLLKKYRLDAPVRQSEVNARPAY
jgi:hypothetical protein